MGYNLRGSIVVGHTCATSLDSSLLGHVLQLVKDVRLQTCHLQEVDEAAHEQDEQLALVRQGHPGDVLRRSLLALLLLDIS